jgi:hypothetical protein
LRHFDGSCDAENPEYVAGRRLRRFRENWDIDGVPPFNTGRA